MHKLKIMAVDKLREPHWRDAAEGYLKRIAPYARLSVVEVSPDPLTDTVTAERSMKKEGERLLKQLPSEGMVIALDRLGKRCSSEEFARMIDDAGRNGDLVTFVVGGAAGLAPEVLSAAQKKISFSEMTFTHEMARVILLEQIYRAMTILAGKKYHY